MPVFIALIILGAIALWFILCFAFRPIGKFFHKLIEDVEENIKDENREMEGRCSRSSGKRLDHS